MKLLKLFSSKISIIKTYLIIIFFSFVAGIYLLESYLTFLKDPKSVGKSKIYKEKTGLNYDSRTKIEVYEELKKKNNKITIRVSPKNFIKNKLVYPLSGVSNSDTLQCNENGYISMYKSDRHGFNNPDAEWSQKEIEYLLVGDSFIHGSCVNRPNDISSVLRSLTGKSVINLGYSANGPLAEYATLREYLNPNVKKVIWVYYEFNDLLDLRDEIKNRILRNYLVDINFSQNLKKRQKEIDEMAKSYINKSIKLDKERKKIEKRLTYKIWTFVKFYNLRKNLKKIFRSLPEPQEEFIKILNLANNLVNENNAQLYFVYLPGYYKYKIGSQNKNYKIVKQIVNDLNIPFIDIHSEVFLKEKNPLDLFPFGMFGHYTPEGYKKVAKTIHRLSK